MKGIITILILGLIFGIVASTVFLIVTMLVNNKEQKNNKNLKIEQNEKIHHNTKA
jgi:preprotein translocase subunit SecF